jgi:negative regulator of flagellin synthesis FlgM
MLDDASRTPGVREQRLAQIKAAIEAGTYETPEKLEIALNRMLDQLNGEQE